MPLEMATKICKPLSTLLLFAILFSVDARRGEFHQSCNVTKKIAKTLFSSSEGVHNISKTDSSLKVCEKNGTCCTRHLERKFEKISEEVRKKLFSKMHESIENIFHNAAKNFTGFFEGLLENSYTDLDKLYTRTYSDKYTNHKAIFRHLFTKLSEYINGTDQMDLKQLVDSWFSMLYQKVYMISNENSIYDASYQHCILETVEMIRPFGDIPRKIGVQIKKSFLASKVIVEALNSGAKVVEALLSMKINKQCKDAFMKMSHCSACIGTRIAKPCHDYCVNVMKGCTAYPAAVGPSWSIFLNALMKLANKVEGPFSMEAVIRPLGVEISAGIMLFQLNTKNITARVEKRCGIPPKKKLKSVKRRSLSGDDMSYPYNFLEGSNSIIGPTTAFGTSLGRLIKKLKTIIFDVKDHWTAVPKTVCATDIAAPRTETENCWNGKVVDSYMHPVVKDGLEEMFTNPEVHLNIKEPNLNVTRQVIKLKEITQRIIMAINGADSNRVDLEEGSADGEDGGEGSGGTGSGDGSGSGDKSGDGLTTSWPKTSPTMGTDDLQNTVEPRSTIPTADPDSNKIPGASDPKGNSEDYFQNGAEKSTGINDNGGATSTTGTILASLLCFAVTGLLLL